MNEKKRVVSYSACSFYLETFFNEEKLSNATCFIVKGKKFDYIVSNWHVFSGRNSDTKEPLSEKGAIPNNIRIDLPFDMGTKIGWADQFFRYDLIDEEGNIKYLQKEKKGKMIDIALLPIKKEINRYFTIDMGEEILNEATKFYIGDFIYILGYPFGRIADYKFPIWKKGSVATEPVYDINELPYFFVDTATREGMSGSPAVYYEKRSIGRIDKFVDKEPLNLSSHYTKFVGVYSGRYPCDSEKGDAQLGRIWKVDSIEEMIKEYEKEET